jgi:nucleolar protein 6
MSLAEPPKLTKKQRKSVAFRERKKGKPQSGGFAGAAADVPEAEDLDAEEDSAAVDAVTPSASLTKPLRNAKIKTPVAGLPTDQSVDGEALASTSTTKGSVKKRKADALNDAPVQDAQPISKSSNKKRRKADIAEEDEEQGGEKGTRRILFLGKCVSLHALLSIDQKQAISSSLLLEKPLPLTSPRVVSLRRTLLFPSRFANQ